MSGLKDVQRFYLLLQPQTPAGGSCRLIVVGKKKLPDTKRHERFFAFVGELATCMSLRCHAACHGKDAVSLAPLMSGIVFCAIVSLALGSLCRVKEGLLSTMHSVCWQKEHSTLYPPLSESKWTRQWHAPPAPLYWEVSPSR